MINYVRKEATVSARIEEELVMVDIEKGSYFALNPVATRIWGLLETPFSVENLCERLIAEYEVDPEQCRIEVEAHLSEMQQLGLIQASV